MISRFRATTPKLPEVDVENQIVLKNFLTALGYTIDSQCGSDFLLKINVVDSFDTRAKGIKWGITWEGNGTGLRIEDLQDIYQALVAFPHVKEFVMQMEICPLTKKLHIHAAILFNTYDNRPVPQFKKRFPGLLMNIIENYELWKSFCSKDYSRVPGTEPLYYNVDPTTIYPFDIHTRKMKEDDPLSLLVEKLKRYRYGAHDRILKDMIRDQALEMKKRI